MSGSKRNRIISLNASMALPDHHTLQSSHRQQVGSTLAPYRQPVSTANNPNAIANAIQATPRPMVIQYALPQYPSSHNPQTRPQYTLQNANPTRALPPPTTTRVTPTTDFAMERLSQSIVTAITPTLTEHEKSVAATIKKVEEFVEKFVKDVREARTATDRWLIRLTEAMQKSLQMQQMQTKAANKRIEKLESLLLASFDRSDELSLISRLENIQYTVGELSERVKDPGAQDLFMVPQATRTVNEVRTIPSPSESIESVSTPIQRIYADRSTLCDISEPSPDLPSPARPLYEDAASDMVDLEPEPPVMLSPIRLESKGAGIDPLPLSPACRLHRMSRSSSFEPPSVSVSGSDYSRSGISAFHEMSLEVNTESGEGSSNDTQTPVDLEEAGLHYNNSGEGSIVVTHSEGEESMIMPQDDDLMEMAYPGGDESMVTDVDTNVAVESHVESHVESELEPVKLLANDEAHGDAQMDDGHESDFAAPAVIIIPLRSPAPIADGGAELAHMVDSESATPAIVEDAFIASSRSPTPAEMLQQTIFSSREASVVTSLQKQHSLSWPATTPSAPASPKCNPSPLLAISVPATNTSQPTQQRPVFTVSSPISSYSEHEREVSLPIAKSDHVGPIYIPVPNPPTPVPAPPPGVNITPNSDGGSEILVPRMVAVTTSDSAEFPGLSKTSPETPVHERVEEPQVQVPMPLFLPGSRSQSPPHTQLNNASHESSRPFLESPPPSRKPTHQTPSKSQSMRPATLVVSTSPTKPPATIFNTPYKKLKRKNSDRSIISIQSIPRKSPTLMRPVIAARPPATPRPKSSPETIVIPTCVPSRSLSPLSVLNSETELSDAGSDVVRVIRKKEPRKDEKIKTQLGSNASTSTSVGPSIDPVLGKGTQRINLLQKLQGKKGESAALTRVRKRKALTAEQMEPPLKRARQKASVSMPVPMPNAEVERGIRVNRERMSVGSSGARAGGRGKTKTMEMETEDAKEYKLTHNKMKTPPVKGDKKLRPRAPPMGVNWPQKNASGDKKFDNQFIECEKCFLWYHYGCIGIMDSNDPVAIGDKRFICPPCSGGSAISMLPSDNIVCARPDCEKEEKKEDEFFMTAIIGRYIKISGGTGRKYMWLVKWDGYSIRECTWEEEDGMSDPHNFIQDFYRRATREGKDPEEDPYSTILLREAILGGWTDPNA